MLVALQEKYRHQIQIIGISEDEGPLDPVKQFVAEHRINYPIIIATPEIEKRFGGVSGLPTSFWIDREGRIVRKHVGLLDRTITELEARALAGLPVDATIERVEAEQVGLVNAAQAKEIPGVDLAALSPAQRTAALKKLNTDRCTCGCSLTLAECRINDSACPVSLPLARKLVDEIRGKTMTK